MENLIESVKNATPEKRKEIYRELVTKVKEAVIDLPESRDKDSYDETNPITHIFGDGFYVRDMSIPTDQFIVTEIHKKENPLFLMKGSCSILTENGVEEVQAPWYCITKPGTHRLIITHEYCNFITVHPTEAKNVTDVLEDIIAKDFKQIKE